MEISLERNYQTAYKAGEKLQKICEASCEIVVPDTKDDIRRILRTDAKYKLRSKDADNGRITLLGEVELSSAYIAEKSGGIDSLRADLPTECVIENDSVRAGGFVLADSRIISVETRTLNPRKILVSVKLLCTVRYYELSEYEWFRKPSYCGCRAYFKDETQEAFFIDSVCEKSFTVENDMEIPELGEDSIILSTYTSFTTDSAEAVGAKLIVKGHAASEISVLCDGKLKTYSTTDSFSQIFDLSERDVLPEYRAVIIPTGDYFRLTNRVVSYEISAVLQLVCMKKSAVTLLCDAYACDRDLSTETKETDLCVLIKSEKASERLSLEQSCDHDIVSTVSASVTLGIPKETDMGWNVPVYADVIYTSSDEELRACRLHGSVALEGRLCEDHFISVQNVRAAHNGNELSVTGELVLELTQEKHECREYISSIHVCEESCGTDTGTVYFARYDEDLWQLAKKYRSDMEIIRALNGAEELENKKGKLIIIPAIR